MSSGWRRARFWAPSRAVHRRVILTLGLALCGVLASGCVVALVGVAAAGGAGAVAYVKGELRATLDANLDRSWEATLAAIKELGFTATKRDKDALTSHLVARGSDDKKIEIRLKRASDATTHVRIRVGLVGDEAYSRQILERIQHHLR